MFTEWGMAYNPTLSSRFLNVSTVVLGFVRDWLGCSRRAFRKTCVIRWGEFKFPKDSRKSHSAILWHLDWGKYISLLLPTRAGFQLSAIDYLYWKVEQWSEILPKVVYILLCNQTLGEQLCLLFSCRSYANTKSIFIFWSFQLTFQAGLLTDRGRLPEF